MIYLDAAATAGYKNTDNVVVEIMADAMREYWQNPSSLYANHVKEEINRCRANVAKFIGAKPEEIIFTSGASESNNMAIRGWVDYQTTNSLYSPTIITTPIEHKSILEAVKNIALDVCVYYCDVDKYGFVDYESIRYWLDLLEYKPALVSIGIANNEIGTVQMIKEISEFVHRHNCILHVDATQMLPYIPIDVQALGIDMMSASGHKISSVLKGIGFLYKKDSVNIKPLIYGSQENKLRGGTENTFGIIGLSKALEYCDTSCDKYIEMCGKRDYFIELLESKFGCKLNGHKDYRLPNNVNVTFPQNITGESLLYTLSLSNIQISTGSACNSKSIEPSHVLKAIGLSDDEAMKTVRFTLPNDITYQDINYVIDEIGKAIKLIEIN